MLPREHRLSTKQDITSALRRGRRRGSTHLVVHIAPSSRPGPARAAFAVSSAVGNSVVRHRVIRQLRAAILPLLQRLPEGTDVVVRALPPARDASYGDLVADLEHCLRGDLFPDPRVGRESVPPPQPDAGEASETPEAPTGIPTIPRHGLGRVLFILGTPLRWLLIGLVTVYRRVISPVLPPTCRYHPSCSAYALEALQVHGVAKGFALATWRIARCNPFTKGGLDPVPPRGAWHPPIHPDGTPRDPHPPTPAARAVGLPDERMPRHAASTP